MSNLNQGLIFDEFVLHVVVRDDLSDLGHDELLLGWLPEFEVIAGFYQVL